MSKTSPSSNQTPTPQSQDTDKIRARLTAKAVRVSQALDTRFSCRAFLDVPVNMADLRDILTRAVRAPSGGNLQPWHIWVLGPKAVKDLVQDVQKKMEKNPAGEGSEYHIYPPNLAEPYTTRRRDIGYRLYDILNIARDDKIGRMRQMARNFEFFGAPCAMFFAIDKDMQEGQWSDLGMLIQSIMLLTREKGLHSCAQEAWAIWAASVKSFLHIPDNMILFCGLAIGYADPAAPVNELYAARAPIEEYTQFVGF